jgi:hypothetical protein
MLWSAESASEVGLCHGISKLDRRDLSSRKVERI